jgi:hypothetical protein
MIIPFSVDNWSAGNSWSYQSLIYTSVERTLSNVKPLPTGISNSSILEVNSLIFFLLYSVENGGKYA